MNLPPSTAIPAAAERLRGSTSPYLESHSSQPVEWYPWGEEALARARAENKPILLSIGYSACHWCHVMAHESFEDPAIAAVMNEHFINIKVDREERPDLDRVYQLAHQLLTRTGGGWPLTLFLSGKDQTPFFGGTYFPRDARHGLPGFADLLARVAQYHEREQDEIAGQNARLRAVLVELGAARALAAPLHAGPLSAARERLEAAFDPDFGGFTPAPKFPHPGMIGRLLRTWHASAAGDAPDLKALYMAALTLTRMAEGGLYDHVGGGFARYSVDRYWMIPHFEKMLYDQGPLLGLLADAATATGEALFRQAALGTADWCVQVLQGADGGFCSSLDADSQGHEGLYYVWDREEIRALLAPATYAIFSARFGLEEAPNFEGRSWHLHAYRPVAEIAERAGISEGQAAAMIGAGLDLLRAARARRVAPARDDKVLPAWNGLMIRGLATAARRLGRPDYAQAAGRALDFARSVLWHDGRLCAVHRDGHSRYMACLDDYVFLAEAALELLQCRYSATDLAFAIALVDAALAHFEDRDEGGFWFTAHDAEPLIQRAKVYADDSLPSGNGVAARVLLRMGHLLGEERYVKSAERVVSCAMAAMTEHPLSHMTMLDALEDCLHPPQIVILCGPAADIEAWNQALAPLYAPRRLVIAIPADAAGLPAALAAKPATATPLAYICEGSVCGPPIDSLPRLVLRLRDGIATGDR